MIYRILNKIWNLIFKDISSSVTIIRVEYALYYSLGTQVPNNVISDSKNELKSINTIFIYQYIITLRLSFWVLI